MRLSTLTPLKKLICSENRAAPPDSPSKAPPSAGRPTDARGWCSGRRQTPPFCRRRVFERRWRGGAVGAERAVLDLHSLAARKNVGEGGSRAPTLGPMATTSPFFFARRADPAGANRTLRRVSSFHKWSRVARVRVGLTTGARAHCQPVLRRRASSSSEGSPDRPARMVRAERFEGGS